MTFNYANYGLAHLFERRPIGPVLPWPSTSASHLLDLYAGTFPTTHLPRFFSCPAALASGADRWFLGDAMSRGDACGWQECEHVDCPYCHRRLMNRRRAALRAVMDAAERRGLGLAMSTVTTTSVPYGGLQAQIRAIAEACSKAREGRPHRRDREELGMEGHVNILHLTWSPSGWHAHRHIVFAAANGECALEAALRFDHRYRRAAGDRSAMTDERGVYDALGLAGYLARPWTRHELGSPFWLAALGIQGNLEAAAAFVELSHALKGQAIVRGYGVLALRAGRGTP